MKLDIQEGSPYEVPIFIDTEVKTSDRIMTQSGIRQMPKTSNTENVSAIDPHVGLLTPVFHLLNSFFSLPPDNIELDDDIGGRIFNIFTLTNGFSATFQFNLKLDVLEHGILNVKGEINRIDSDASKYTGGLELDVTREAGFKPVTEFYTEVEGEGIVYVVEFEKVGAGQLQFTQQQVSMVSPTGHTLQIRWFGEGSAGERACLLAENSLVKTGTKFFVRMSDQDYCNEDCRSEEGCSYYCVDLPTFYSKRSSKFHYLLVFFPF